MKALYRTLFIFLLCCLGVCVFGWIQTKSQVKTSMSVVQKRLDSLSVDLEKCAFILGVPVKNER